MEGNQNDLLKKTINSFLANGYPESVIQSNIKLNIFAFYNSKTFGTRECPGSIKIPWIESSSHFFADKTSPSLMLCFNSTVVQPIFITRNAFPSIRKDMLPTLKQNFVCW